MAFVAGRSQLLKPQARPLSCRCTASQPGPELQIFRGDACQHGVIKTILSPAKGTPVLSH